MVTSSMAYTTVDDVAPENIYKARCARCRPQHFLTTSSYNLLNMANLGNVARGHKAAMANPNVSEEAKKHSKQVLEEMEGHSEHPERDDEGKHVGNVIGGHKATLKNPNVSEGAKEHSRQVLEDMDA